MSSENIFTQRRKAEPQGAKKTILFVVLRLGFAPLRERSFR